MNANKCTGPIGRHAPEVPRTLTSFTSRDADIREITANKAVTDFNGIISPESYERGGKVWFREFTGIKPVPLSVAFADRFIRAAHERYPV